MSIKTITKEELAKFDGKDENTPVYIAINGKIYDCSSSRNFYGKDGAYEIFAGKEVSRALATMKIEEQECNDDLNGLDSKQLKTLEDWIKKFDSKYPCVGQTPISERTPVQPRKKSVPWEKLLRILFYLLAALATYFASRFVPQQ